MTDQIVLVEFGAFNTETSLMETLRFCDGLGYRLRPTEVPANELYRPFVLDPGWSRIDVFSSPGDYGHVTPGECVLDDSSGKLGTELLKYDFRTIIIRIGERGAAYPGDFVTIINGSLSRAPAYSWGKITFSPADLAASLEKPLQKFRFAGNNVLPNGVEGMDDLLSKVKLMVFGLASNLSPLLCNTSKLIYQVSVPVGTAIHSISAVRDGGNPLTGSVGYTNMADMITNAPASGQYRVLSTVADGCYIRLGGQPERAITCDVAYGSAADRTHAQVWRRILIYGGVDPAAISTADVAALDTALPAEIELAILAETTISAQLSVVANSAAAAWYGDQSGIFRLAQWLAPAGPPVATVTDLRTDEIGIDDPVGNDGVAPVYLVNLSYGRNWTTQSDADLGGDKTSISDPVAAPGGRTGLAARNWLRDANRVAPATDAAVQTAYRNAVKLELTSLIANQASAQAFANAQLAAYKVARITSPLSCWLTDAQIEVTRPGAVVLVTQVRWGFQGGKLMRIAGVQIDRQTKKTQLTCWG